MIPRRRSIRRVLALLVINGLLGGLTVAIAHGYTDGREAMRDRLSRQLRNLSTERSLSEEERAYLESNRTAYQALVEDGMLAPPDRLAVAALLERLQEAHGLNAIRYSFSPQFERSGPGDGRLSVLSTNVTIERFGITYNDMLGFAEAVLSDLPGDIRVTGLRLSRRETVDASVLNRLRAGEAIDLVEGLLTFEWCNFQWRERAHAPAPS
jgi:hypothetical protein